MFRPIGVGFVRLLVLALYSCSLCQDLFAITSLRLPPSQYFAVEKDRKIKIQFQMDHQMFRSLPFYFAYRMHGFWDRSGETKSNPFIDINHYPELFVLLGTHHIVGFEHASNGVDNEPAGPDQRRNRSRSVNRLYWQNYYRIFGSEAWVFNLRLDAPIRSKNSTPLHDYIGILKTGVELRSSTERIALISYSRGIKGYQFLSQASIDLVASLTDRRPSKTQLFAEYFDGYGDYLLDFDQKRQVYRIGLSFIR